MARTREEKLAACRAWKQANPEKVRAYNEANREKRQAYFASRRAEKSAYDKIYRATHSRRPNLEWQKTYNELYGPRKSELARARRVADIDRFRARERAWKAANPELHRLYERNRRARKRAAEGVHTIEDEARIRKAQKNRCVHCAKKLSAKSQLNHISNLLVRVDQIGRLYALPAISGNHQEIQSTLRGHSGGCFDPRRFRLGRMGAAVA